MLVRVIKDFSNKLKQLFCNHEYKEGRERVPFYYRNGDVLYLKCIKCGKVKNKEWQLRE